MLAALRRRRFRHAVVPWLAAFVLAMQQLAAVHPIEHLREALGRHDTPVLQKVADACEECLLLAAAAHGVTADAHASTVDIVPPAIVVPAQTRGRPSPFAAYRSRAPPARA
ncbi:MAG: hypothetical protein JSR18_03510 [Proteobacteria bacterium]|nr:hypothetical protein [Pseudomonadota bacterium]